MQGKSISGYILQRPLGTSGMAEVWYAENQIGKKAAVKLLLPQLCQDGNMKSCFFSEAKMMVGLNHPNIRQMYDYGDIEGRPAIVLEYLECYDLQSRLNRGPGFTEMELERWWNQLVDALGYIHAKGIVHRDLRPGSIFIDRMGNIKLLDFGVVKASESVGSMQASRNLGSLIYMSPEQVNNSKYIDYRTDLYSLAVTFVHLLSGKQPYDTVANSANVISEQIAKKPLDMSGIPAKWQSLLAPYLEKDPQKRPALCRFGFVPKPVKTNDDATIVDAPAASDPAPKRKSKIGLWIGLGVGAMVLVTAAVAIVLIVLKPWSKWTSEDNGGKVSYVQEDTRQGKQDDGYGKTTEKQEEEPINEESSKKKDVVKKAAADVNLFSVSPSKQVYFSKGNLQYQPSTSTWQFANNQWETIGQSNVNISSSYSGWIDLFSWGTGNKPTNYSTDNDDYVFFNDWGWYYDGLGWRTPNKEEWQYLFEGRSNAENKYGAAKVNGVAGIVVLPDEWTLPSGLTFSNSTSYSQNDYSISEWRKMEDAGAIFLPTAGRRDGKEMFKHGKDGDYWSSTPHSTGRAYNVDFSEGSFNAQDNSPTKHAFAVRLIMDKNYK